MEWWKGERERYIGREGEDGGKKVEGREGEREGESRRGGRGKRGVGEEGEEGIIKRELYYS